MKQMLSLDVFIVVPFPIVCWNYSLKSARIMSLSLDYCTASFHRFYALHFFTAEEH